MKAKSILLVDEYSGPWLSVEASRRVEDTLANDDVSLSTHQRFRKTIVRIGTFKKGNETIEITAAHLDHWVDTFNAMKEADLRIPIPLLHDPRALPTKNINKILSNPEYSQGWVDSLFVEGKELVMIADLIGDDAAELVLKSRVSIRAPKTWTDGTGKQWQHPITHVALVTDPVVVRLGEWLPIAASLDADIEDTAIEAEEQLNHEGQIMDLERLGEALGISDLTEENAFEKIVAAFKKNKEETKEETKEEVEEVNAALLSLSIKDRKREIKDLLNDNRITPVQYKELDKEFVSTEAVTLSLASPDAFEQMINILKKAKAELKQASGPQTLVELSRETESNWLQKDAEKRAKKAESTGAFVG